MLSEQFKRRGIEHVVLNAKPEHAQKEGETVAQAGRLGAVTIATNMAGRGVDIKLGGDPEQMAAARAAQARPQARRTRAGSEEHAELTRQARAALHRGGRAGPRARRPLHLRHRAARVAPDRQPASRPRRPPGRPGRDPLLPQRRGRPRAALRRRPDLQDPRPPRPRRRGRRGVPARGEDALASRSRRRRRRSRSRTSSPVSACSSTTTS